MFSEHYEIDSSPFAFSSSSSIYKCRSRVTRKVCAVKKYSETTLSERRRKLVESEAVIALKIPLHPNIMHIYGLYQEKNDKNLYLVMEWMRGGNMLDYLQNNGPLPEYLAQECIRQILQGLSHLHKLHIMHRDIKPENIFIKNNFSDGAKECLTIVLGDFGFATNVIPNSEYMGSPQYSAPETVLIALRGNSIRGYKPMYNEKCDVWSVGVLTFVLLTGLLPFDGVTPTEVFNNVLRNEIPFDKLWHNKSLTHVEKITKFIKRLTETNPSNRVDTFTALHDP